MTSETRDELIAEAREKAAEFVRNGDSIMWHQSAQLWKDAADLITRLAAALSLSAPAVDRDAIIEECAKVADEYAARMDASSKAQKAKHPKISNAGLAADCKYDAGVSIAGDLRALKSGDPT